MAVSLFIAGDVVPKGIQPEIFKNNGEQIFHEIKPYITGSDFSIVNLEAPVIDGNLSPIKKSGPCLSTSYSTIKVLKEVGVGIVTLANNHFFDQGQNGVESTIYQCDREKIKTIGGGVAIRKAREPLLLEHEGKHIAIINACEHEFSIANTEHGGSNPLDLINIQEDIVKVRKQADYVVLILHGGVEQYQYPTPRMKRWYRHFLDLGADAVVNHHQHCMNGYEVYKGKPILYGLGNFYFPGGTDRPKSWQYGYAVRLVLSERIDYELIPFKQTIDGIELRDMTEFNNEIEILNLPIDDDFLLQQKFDEHLINIKKYLQSQLLPSFFKGKVFSAIAGRGMLGKLYKGNQIFNVKNKLTCESHAESLSRLFEILTMK